MIPLTSCLCDYLSQYLPFVQCTVALIYMHNIMQCTTLLCVGVRCIRKNVACLFVGPFFCVDNPFQLIQSNIQKQKSACGSLQ